MLGKLAFSATLSSCGGALLMEVHDYFNILINGVSLKGVLEWNIRYEPSRHGQKRQVCSNSNMRAHRKDDELWWGQKYMHTGGFL